MTSAVVYLKTGWGLKRAILYEVKQRSRCDQGKNSHKVKSGIVGVRVVELQKEEGNEDMKEWKSRTGKERQRLTVF